MQFLVSGIIIICICYFISNTDTHIKFSYHKLTGNLLNLSIILSLVAQIILSIFFQVLCVILLKRQEWYINNRDNSEMIDYDNIIIFLISNLQYFICSIAFSITYPFKKEIFKNYLFILFLLLGFGYFAYLIIAPDKVSLKYLNLDVFPVYFFRRVFLCICLLNLLCSYIFESYIIPYFAFLYKKQK